MTTPKKDEYLLKMLNRLSGEYKELDMTSVLKSSEGTTQRKYRIFRTLQLPLLINGICEILQERASFTKDELSIYKVFNNRATITINAKGCPQVPGDKDLQHLLDKKILKRIRGRCSRTSRTTFLSLSDESIVNTKSQLDFLLKGAR